MELAGAWKDDLYLEEISRLVVAKLISLVNNILEGPLQESGWASPYALGRPSSCG
jgi:hypothetical protein